MCHYSHDEKPVWVRQKSRDVKSGFVKVEGEYFKISPRAIIFGRSRWLGRLEARVLLFGRDLHCLIPPARLIGLGEYNIIRCMEANGISRKHWDREYYDKTLWPGENISLATQRLGIHTTREWRYLLEKWKSTYGMDP